MATDTNNSAQAGEPSESKGDILEFTPQNFHQSIAVHFPHQRLPVCERCKKNSKSRDICRIRCGHTQLPWATSYVCITLDESCTGEDGRYILGKTLVAKTVEQHQPLSPPSLSSAYHVKELFTDPKTLCCHSCKIGNRSKKFCRDKHKHKDLPWTTVYVVLSASTGIEIEQKNNSTRDNKNDTTSENGDDINNIPPSRTFLCTISSKQNSVQWLEQRASLKSNVVAATSGTQQNNVPSAAVNPIAASAAIQQLQHAAAWQSYNQFFLNQMLDMQNQASQARHHHSLADMQKTLLLGGGNNNKKRKRGRKPKMLKDEANAAIANAKQQAHTEYNNALLMGQSLASSSGQQMMMMGGGMANNNNNGMMMQQGQMMIGMMQYMQQQAHLNAATQQYVESEVAKKQNQCPTLAQTPGRKKKSKKNSKKSLPLNEDDGTDLVGISNAMEDGRLTAVVDDDTERLPFDDNPEEVLDWFDSSFNVK